MRNKSMGILWFITRLFNASLAVIPMIIVCFAIVLYIMDSNFIVATFLLFGLVIWISHVWKEDCKIIQDQEYFERYEEI